MTRRTQLPNNCYIGKISIFPENWLQAGASTDKPWRIQYRFFDPSLKSKYPKGMLRIVKGMNHLSGLEARRAETKKIKQTEIEILKEGFNPITGNEVTIQPNNNLNLSTPFLDALELALEELSVVPKTKANIKSHLKYLSLAAIKVNYYRLGIGEIERWHINTLLKTLETIRPSWTESLHNKYRTSLMILFSQLLDMVSIKTNPVKDVKRMDEVVKERNVLSKEDRRKIDLHLKKKGLTSFRLYNRLFFHSGIRNTEMLQLKECDVNIIDQILKVTVLKGGKKTIHHKPIKTIALRYWKLALHRCLPGDYIFSKNLVPGKSKIDPSQITRRWERHVKEDLKMDVDFYQHKHANTTETVDYVSAKESIEMAYKIAANQNSHKSTAMVKKIYDTKRYSREHESSIKVANEY